MVKSASLLTDWAPKPCELLELGGASLHGSCYGWNAKQHVSTWRSRQRRRRRKRRTILICPSSSCS